MLPPQLTDKKIVLASNSPRRRELLHLIVPQYDTALNRDIPEEYPADLPAEEVAPFLSRLKAEARLDSIDPDEILITADTVVILDGEILGKPADEDEACRMLERLAGRTHKVVTGVTLASEGRMDTFAETTLVTFSELTPKQIRTYVDTFRPLDKAGAYGIQEWLGCIGISGISGCFYNVMGLPLHALYHHLTSFC